MHQPLPCPALPYIPQRPPFVLVDDLLDVTETRAVTAFTVPDGHVLCEKGALSAEGLVENMAQTAAAGAGYREQAKNQPSEADGGAVRDDTGHSGMETARNGDSRAEPSGHARVGFIGAVKSLAVQRLPVMHTRLTTSCEVRHVVGNATIVACEVQDIDATLASCELTIFLEPAGGQP